MAFHFSTFVHRLVDNLIRLICPAAESMELRQPGLEEYANKQISSPRRRGLGGAFFARRATRRLGTPAPKKFR